jgi:hypothetical protein
MCYHLKKNDNISENRNIDNPIDKNLGFTWMLLQLKINDFFLGNPITDKYRISTWISEGRVIKHDSWKKLIFRFWKQIWRIRFDVYIYIKEVLSLCREIFFITDKMTTTCTAVLPPINLQNLGQLKINDFFLGNPITDKYRISTWISEGRVIKHGYW